MNFFLTAWTIFAKEIALEFKTREFVVSTALFALLIVVFSAFAFDAHNIQGAVAASGSLWLAICFGGVLAIGRSYLKEREMGVWTGLILSPASRSGIYVGKLAGLFLFLLIVSLLLLPVEELFFHVPVFNHLHLIAPIIILGLFGFSAIGALFGAMIVRTSVRELLLGVVMLPLVAPILILSAKATMALLAGEPWIEIFGYLKLVAVLDIIYFAIGLWLFEPLMED